MSIDATAFLADMQKLEAELLKDTRKSMEAAVRDSEIDAKGTVLYRDVTTNLRQKTKGNVISDTEGELRADTDYAEYIENGTPPHPINGTPFLKFQFNGATVFVRSVQHPGTAPRPFMEHAGKVGEETLVQVLEALVSESISQFNS